MGQLPRWARADLNKPLVSPRRHSLRREPGRRHTGPETWGHTLRRETGGHTVIERRSEMSAQFCLRKILRSDERQLTQRERQGNREASYQGGTRRGVEHKASVEPRFHRLSMVDDFDELLCRVSTLTTAVATDPGLLTRGHQGHPTSRGDSLSRSSHHPRSVLLVWRWSVDRDRDDGLST